jgi:hypothetical protein
MKKCLLYFFLAAIFLFLLSLGGCELLGVSIDKRIEMFFDDINNNRSGAVDNFHPDLAEDYDLIGVGTWGTAFPVGDGTPYTYSGLNDSNPSNVTCTVYGPPTFLGPKTATFTMGKIDSDYYCGDLWLDATQVVD